MADGAGAFMNGQAMVCNSISASQMCMVYDEFVSETFV